MRLNWPAVSALAAVAAAVVALMAFLAPPATPPQPQPDAVAPTPATQSSSSDPETTRPAPPTPSPSRESSPPQSPMPSSTRAAPASSEPLSAVRPGGCDAAAAALTAYRQNAGTVRSSQAAAAQQTYRDLMGAGLDAQGVVGAKISRLAAEFQELNFRLTGMTGGDPNQVIADINTDVTELNRLCGSL
ncbi:hypothetical protein [Nonomuraea cavernae]|uniref:Uncharacterized protein n=1 Tax=Nonomuraea cavernae TaxID=2045107 RepID=A0A917YPZ1_9ACTN|nr:hypothetical protein [Nonomuraea cavernae]MCA2183569.1 hypothetical protein [Nonomuraea cavernae]GGO60700.1 hypothetical protein GCM10012289_01180 [Nonomuraea cavernae]